jgi:hypothetical protein
VSVYVCMYECVYVCVCVCMYECVCVYLPPRSSLLRIGASRRWYMVYGIICIKDTYVVCKYVKKTHMLYVNMLKRQY